MKSSFNFILAALTILVSIFLLSDKWMEKYFQRLAWANRERPIDPDTIPGKIAFKPALLDIEQLAKAVAKVMMVPSKPA